MILSKVFLESWDASTQPPRPCSREEEGRQLCDNLALSLRS